MCIVMGRCPSRGRTKRQRLAAFAVAFFSTADGIEITFFAEAIFFCRCSEVGSMLSRLFAG